MSRPAPADANEACDGARGEYDTPTLFSVHVTAPRSRCSVDSDLSHRDAAVRPDAIEASPNV